LLPLLRDQVTQAAAALPDYQRYIDNWPVAVEDAAELSELPYLPVACFKRDPPLSHLHPDDAQRVLRSSATTSQQPSQILVDRTTARRMSKGVARILRDFIGSERRPMLVIDVPSSVAPGITLGARGAAIRGLQPFATTTVTCLNEGEELQLDLDSLWAFADAHWDQPVLIYGFTWVLWKRLIAPLDAEGVRLNLTQATILHSGGWKKLTAEKVDKATLCDAGSRVFGCAPDRVMDFYGMVEQVGVVYPDCAEGHKHAPAFAEVLIRDPLTLAPVSVGETGLIQVCSVLPSSFPGQLLLTEDLATVMAYDGCACGRRGIAFRFAGRAPQAELRGCGDVAATRTDRPQ
jgi:phenylacetate-coenzyme A ligase PaaK-like adenylate-forming protein